MSNEQNGSYMILLLCKQCGQIVPDRAHVCETPDANAIALICGKCGVKIEGPPEAHVCGGSNVDPS